MRSRSEPALLGVIVYEGVEPIDIGGTVGVVSMASRVLPGLKHTVISEEGGSVKLASGLMIEADHGFENAPACDAYIVTGGPGWKEQVTNPAMLTFLASLPNRNVASVCTGALILAASGQLAGRTATTRRHKAGAESDAPLTLLLNGGVKAGHAAAIVDDKGLITSGGVSLAIDGTLYIIGKIYGEEARDEAAAVLEYDRAFAANRAALGHVIL